MHISFLSANLNAAAEAEQASSRGGREACSVKVFLLRSCETHRYEQFRDGCGRPRRDGQIYAAEM